MAGERVKLVVSERTQLGSAESRRLRRQGLVPGVLYGRSEPVAISIGERDLRAALTTPAGAHAVLDVTVDGGSAHSAILKEYQRDKVRGTITHVDFLEVRLDQPIQTTVAVHLVGDSVGVREGGVLTQVTTEVGIEALPLEVPQGLEADVSELGVGETPAPLAGGGPGGRRAPRRPETRSSSRRVQLAREEEPSRRPRRAPRRLPRARRPRAEPAAEGGGDESEAEE